MVDAVGQRRGPAAQRELHRLLESAEPLYALSMIVRQFRLLLQAREMLDERRERSGDCRGAGAASFPAGKVCQQARSFNLADLEQIYSAAVGVRRGDQDGPGGRGHGAGYLGGGANCF